MENLINEMYEIIKDHRDDEEFMSPDRIKDWVEQFKEEDREFVLKETTHILKKRYISKEDAKKHVRNMLQYLTKSFEYTDVCAFIKDSYFINNQGEEKSQWHLLNFLDEILKSEFKCSLADCNEKEPKFIVYLDDILCTGETIVRGMCDEDDGWFNQPYSENEEKTNYDYFKESGAKFVLAYLAVHKKCVDNLRGRFYHTLGEKNVDFTYVWDTDFMIENDTSVAGSSLNFLFPTENSLNEQSKECKQHIEEKVGSSKYSKIKEIPLRPIDKPTEEKLFSSKENRIKYETIILEKSIEFYNRAENLHDKPRPKPLGYGQYSEMSFGFGTMIFTWRNVPYNTPLVFWYPHHDCIPLFCRNFT